MTSRPCPGCADDDSKCTFTGCRQCCYCKRMLPDGISASRKTTVLTGARFGDEFDGENAFKSFIAIAGNDVSGEVELELRDFVPQTAACPPGARGLRGTFTITVEFTPDVAELEFK